MEVPSSQQTPSQRPISRPNGTVLQLPHGQLHSPAFLPDATLGVVRSVDSGDLARCKVQGVVMNTFHLMQRPGSSTIQAFGGLHQLCGWQRPIITDSGGFQAYSLIRQNPTYGRLTDAGILFRSEGSTRKFRLTPEKTVQLQLSYGTDIVICLDDCTHAEDSYQTQLQSVQRTIEWARRGKEAFERVLDQKGVANRKRPLLFAVIQGGASRELRKRCAKELLHIGFDGFGYGGWPLDSEGNLLVDILAYTRELVPPEIPLHGLGIGHPANVVACARMGYTLFDSAMPTRDARHGRLYAFKIDPAPSELTAEWFSYIYIGDKKHIKAHTPLSPGCDCLCCTDYSLGYLHHLFKLNDCLFQRLATIHNLRFMTQLMAHLRSQTQQGGGGFATPQS
jgi:queuine tRNA-ribosyltransferase